jgi:hypothetical protein
VLRRVAGVIWYDGVGGGRFIIIKKIELRFHFKK